MKKILLALVASLALVAGAQAQTASAPVAASHPVVAVAKAPVKLVAKHHKHHRHHHRHHHARKPIGQLTPDQKKLYQGGA